MASREPVIFGVNAGLPAWIMQYTDPSDEDFQRSFRGLLDLTRGTSRDLINRNSQLAATSLVPWQPYDASQQDVAQSVTKTATQKVADWWERTKSPDDGSNRNALDDLFGQARAHGIRDPESWNPDQLAGELEKRRASGIVANLQLPFDNPITQSIAQFGSSVYGSLIDIARDMPFVGDALTSIKAVRNADQVFAAMEEYYKTQADMGKMGDVISGVGTFTAYAGASYLAWQGLAMMGVGAMAAPAANASRMNKIAQMALIGGADAWLLTGGGDAPLEQRGMNIIAGAGLGGLMGVGARTAGGALGATAGAGLMHASGAEDPGDIMLGALVGGTLGVGAGTVFAYRALQQRAKESFPTRAFTEPNPAPASYGTPIPPGGKIRGLEQLDPNLQDVPFAPEPVSYGPVRMESTPPTDAIPFTPESGSSDLSSALQFSRGEPIPLPEPQLGGVDIFPSWQKRVLEAEAAERGIPLSGERRVGIGTNLGRRQSDLTQADFDLPPQDFMKRLRLQEGNGIAAPPGTESHERFLEEFLARSEGLENAARDGVNLAKQNIIMESPAVAEPRVLPRRGSAAHEAYLQDFLARSEPLAQVAKFDDFDVAVAQQMTTPGQSMVVNDVQDPALFLRRAAESGKIAPEEIRFVAGPRGTTRVVIGDVQRVDQLASQLHKDGVFEGQLVKDAYGNEGVVRGVKDGIATVSGKYSDEVRRVKVGELLPEPHAMEEHPQGQGFYAALRKYAERRMTNEVERAGYPRQPTWTSDEMSSQLPIYMDELFDRFGITASERGPISHAVDKYRLRDMMDEMAEGDRFFVDNLRQEAGAIFDDYVGSTRYAPPVLEDYAATRGFSVEYGDGHMDGRLIHASGEAIPFGTREEALEFLKGFHAAEPSLALGMDEAVPPPFGTSAREGGSMGATTYENAFAAAEETAKLGTRMSPVEGDTQVPSDFAAAIAEAAEGRTEAYVQTVAHAHSGWARLWEPRLYGVIQQLEDDIVGRLGIPGATPFADVQNLNIKLGQANNANVEWARRFDNAIRGISRARVRNGDLFEVAQLPAEQRAAMMTMREYKPSEIQAAEELRAFFDDANVYARERGVDIGYLPDYMPHIRKAVAGQTEIKNLPENIQWFAEMMRHGGISTMETDVSVLAARYIHGMNRKIYAAPEYNRVVGLWQDTRIPEEIRNPVLNYIQDKFYGRTQVGTLSRLSRDILNVVGKPLGLKFTASDVETFTSQMVRLWYTSVLGRVETITRDMIQPLWASGEMGSAALKEFVSFHLGGVKYKREAIELGMKHGWIERGRMQIEHADVFQSRAGRTEPGDPVLTEADLARRADWREKVNQVFDVLPSGRASISNIIHAPSKPFEVLGYANRAIPGKAGFDLANEALPKFYSGEITGKQLIHAAKLDGARAPVQNEFMRLAHQGPVAQEQAAVWSGHYFADSQFRYGSAESPELMQGSTGRLLAMTGTFSNQALRRYKDALLHGSIESRARFVAYHGALYLAIGAASEATGIRGITRLWWWPGVFFGGGPALQFGADVAAGVGAMSQIVSGQEVGREGQQALSNLQDVSVNQFNPYQGVMRNVTEFTKAAGSAIPLQELGSVFFSGRTDPSQFYGRTAGELVPEAFAAGMIPPAYADINGVLNDRAGAQGLGGSGVFFPAQRDVPAFNPDTVGVGEVLRWRNQLQGALDEGSGQYFSPGFVDRTQRLVQRADSILASKGVMF